MSTPSTKLALPCETVPFFPLFPKRGKRQRQTIHGKNTCSGTKSHDYWSNDSASRLLVTVNSDTRKVDWSNEVVTSSSEILFLWSFLSQRWAGLTVKEAAQLFRKKQQLPQQPQLPSCRAALIWDRSTCRGHAVCVVEVWGCHWQL